MIQPQDEAQLAQAISGATAPFAIRGGGTRPIGRPVAGEVLDVSALTGVSLYEPESLTLVVRAGTPLAEVEATLAAQNQCLPFEPMDHRALLGTTGTPTIGGVVAANVSGPRRVQAGACRDSLIGVRFVDGQGRILKNGGRVMKNVTGYDLVKLMAGSHGTLGVLSEVAFKVLPRSDATAVLLIEGLEDGVAVKTMNRALGSPYEVSGAAHAQRGVDGHPVTMLRLEGFAKSVAYRAEKLRALLQDVGDIAVETDPERTAAGWAWVRDVTCFADQPGDVWKISARGPQAAELVARVPDAQALYDWGGGLIWLLVPKGRDLRCDLGTFDGHATLVRADTATRAELPVFAPQAPAIAAISAALRQKYDPRAILNPGLMG